MTDFIEDVLLVAEKHGIIARCVREEEPTKGNAHEKQNVHQEGSHKSTSWQVGGSHYKQFNIQPIEFFIENKNVDEFLSICQKDILKYIMRGKGSTQDRIEDFKKAKQFCDFAIEKLVKEAT